jgi:proteasome lid subunit RPN8/RPN11
VIARIELSRDHLARIEASAREAFPYECCGLLIGVTETESLVRVTRIAESRNLALPECADRFEIDPALQFSLLRELRGTAESIVGVYHSHPDGRPSPSPRDLEDARDPSLIWLITAVRDGKGEAPATTRAFRLVSDATRFDEIGLSTAR